MTTPTPTPTRTPPPAAPLANDASPEALLAQAEWWLYIDSTLTADFARRALAALEGAPESPSVVFAGWLDGFSLQRKADVAGARARFARVREMAERLGDVRGQLLCEEGEALVLRTERRLEESLAVQLRIAERLADGQSSYCTANDVYIFTNSRAVTRNLLGQTDEMLRDFYRAQAAAQDTPSPGPRINALVNLGGSHGDLYNLHESLELSERGMDLAEAAGAWQAFAIAGLNVLIALDGTRQGERARPVVERMLAHAAQMPEWMLRRNAPVIAMAFLAVGDLEQAGEWLARSGELDQGDGDSRTDHARVSADYLLRRGEPEEARRIAEARIAECEHDRGSGVQDQPYLQMRLLQAAADACEAVGDYRAATGYLRQVQSLYETLSGRGTRAGAIALQARHDYERARAEADHARAARETAEHDRARLAQLNAALQQKMAEAEALQLQLREQAIRDPLTRLYNRRFLSESAPGRIELARRTASPLCVALIDVDHFKRVNDQHGHAAGDQVLQAFAEMLAERFRKSDLVCRFGGEEFLLLLDPCDEEALRALLVALIERLRERSFRGKDGDFDGCTFSAGLAVLDADGSDYDALVHCADERLYRAKAEGRARVVGRDG